MRRLKLLSAARDDFIDPRLLRFYARDPACICARLALVELAEPSSRKPELAAAGAGLPKAEHGVRPADRCLRRAPRWIRVSGRREDRPPNRLGQCDLDEETGRV